MPRLAAVDLGAQSGRVALGTFDGERLAVDEVHRFENTPATDDGILRWDFERLYRDTLAGLAAAAPVDSVAVDSWGVDFGLLDRNGGRTSRGNASDNWRTALFSSVLQPGGRHERAFRPCPRPLDRPLA